MSVIGKETNRDMDNISWWESSSSSENETTATEACMADLFRSLMPKAANDNKEIITLTSGQVVFNEKENQLRRLLNSTFLLEYLSDYIFKKASTKSKIYLKDIADIKDKTSFIRVLQYYPGFTFHDKLMEFIESYNYVFIVDEKQNKRISVNLSAGKYVDEAYARLIKEMVLFCIEEGKTDVDRISEYVKEMFQQEPFSRYAKMTSMKLKSLISKYPDELHVDRHQQVHFYENLSNNNSKVTLGGSSHSKLVAFFEKELQSTPDGLFFKELPQVLSWKKPELLAELSERNAQSIFKILAANSLFEAKDNYIRLKSAKMKPTLKNIIKYDSKFLKSLARKSRNISLRPKTDGMYQYDKYMISRRPANAEKKTKDVIKYDNNFLKPGDDKSRNTALKPKTEGMVQYDKRSLSRKPPEPETGTIVSLSSVQGSIWWSPRSNSRGIFVPFSLQTIINGHLVSDLKIFIRLGDRVKFFAISNCIRGRNELYAVMILLEQKPCPICNNNNTIFLNIWEEAVIPFWNLILMLASLLCPLFYIFRNISREENQGINQRTPRGRQYQPRQKTRSWRWQRL